MYIEKDYSYISETETLLINEGYGKMSVHSIHFDRHFSEEQKAKNRAIAETMTNEEWSEYCDKFAKSLATLLENILQEFVEKYDIHQVSEETNTLKHYNSDWDLFFWSDKGWNKKDFMTHFSLTFNDNRSPEQNMELLEKIIPLVETIKYENIGCRIQYDAVIDEEKIEEEAKTICESLVGKFIEYRDMTGKIKVVREENGIKKYGFFKKNSKINYYHISSRDLVAMKIMEEKNEI